MYVCLLLMLVCAEIYLCMLVFVCSGIRLCMCTLLNVCMNFRTVPCTQIYPLGHQKSTMSSLCLDVTPAVLKVETLTVAHSARGEDTRNNTPEGYLLWSVFIVNVAGFRIT